MESETDLSNGSVLIAVVGLAGTGKSTAVDLLKDAFGGSVVYFGGVVIAETQRRGLPVNETNERMVREELRSKRGMGAIAQLALPAILEARRRGGRNSLVIIDGLYSGAEMDVLRDELHLRVDSIAIHAPRHLREQRLEGRARRPLTPSEIEQRDLMETRALDKATPIALADYHVVNDQDLEAFRENLFRVARSLMSRDPST